jgi:hypothetical protein
MRETKVRRKHEKQKGTRTRTLVVLVQVHQREDLVDTLLGGVLIGRQLDHLTRHVVNRLNNLEHLVVGNEAVVVDVVELESPCR